MIEIRNVSKKYDDTVIFQDVSLNIDKGDRVVIIGESGCGKSTLLRCINGLNKVDSGEIILNGKDITKPVVDINEIRKKIGMVYQQFNLFSHLNVIENVMLAPMKVLGMSQNEAADLAEKHLKAVGMGHRMNHMPSQLSGGQKQRVAIARALAMDPEVMLFDEPTSALDPAMVDEVESVIRKLADDGMTCVIVTHEMSFAKKIATKVVFMAEKGIYEEGGASIIDNPTRSRTRKFIYRSKMYVKNLNSKTFDEDLFFMDICRFMSRFDFGKKQLLIIKAIIDEILYPMFDSAPDGSIDAEVRFIGSESGTDHMLLISFPGVKDDPIEGPYIEKTNLEILRYYETSVMSKKNGDGEWEIYIQL